MNKVSYKEQQKNNTLGRFLKMNQCNKCKTKYTDDEAENNGSTCICGGYIVGIEK